MRTRTLRRMTGCRGPAWAAALLFASASWLGADEPDLLARPDAFDTLVNPACSHCVDEAKSRALELRADDPVLAWTRGKYEGGAIPIRFFLNPYRVISDTYGVFVFDPDAGFARGFEPSLDFTFYGWKNGIVVMKHKDGTLFSTLSGRAFAGPRAGESLKPIATVTSTWGYWNKAYPGSVAYRMFEKYRPTELPEEENADSKGTRGAADPRLPVEARVLGVSWKGARKAYPIEGLPAQGGVVGDTLGGEAVAILWYAPTRTAVAYAPRLDGPGSDESVELAFDAAEPSAPFVDRRSGSRFGIEGRAVSGPLKGRTLRWIDSVQCRWFAWAAEYPDTLLYDAKAARGNPATGNASLAPQAKQPLEMVLVAPTAVTTRQVEAWRGEGFSAAVVHLDEAYSADDYRAATAAAQQAGIDLYYWIEVARNPPLAEAHPRWMAALGMHNDWQARFPAMRLPGSGEVAKAFPWVPIGYAEAFDAHLKRIAALLKKVPEPYQGLLLNDLQGGPASCGCGNLQCRWALDYGVPATATKQGVDDAAARFVAKVCELVPGKQTIPVWMTECEELDLPADKAPDGRSTGLCGSVGCAKGTCPKAFAKQWTALVNSHPGALGLLAAQESCGRDATYYGGPTGWIAASVAYLDSTRVGERASAVPHERLWLVVQGGASSAEAELSARVAARRLQPGAVIAARIALDQTYEPRIVAVD